jgi:hypothetical protein
MEDLINSLVNSISDSSLMGDKFKKAFFDMIFTENPQIVPIFKIIADLFPKEEVDKIPADLYDVVLAESFLKVLPEKDRKDFNFIVKNTYMDKIVEDLYNRRIRELRKELQDLHSLSDEENP